MLFDQRLSRKRLRTHRNVEMVHRSRAVEDLYLRIGKFRAYQRGQRFVVDHDYEGSFGTSARMVCASERASRRVSGKRSELCMSERATPAARITPVTPTRTAGMP